MLQPDDHETVRFVCEELGPTLTAALSGTRNRLDVDAWMKAGHDHITPTDDQLNRLRFAHSLFQRAIDKKGEDIGTRSTRAWFLGGNVGPELDTPMTAIREDRFDEVNTSHERMLQKDHYGVYSDEAATLAEKYCGVFLI